MTIDEVQERWNLVAEGKAECCKAFSLREYPEKTLDEDGFPTYTYVTKRCQDLYLCIFCQAYEMLHIFTPGENDLNCADLYGLHKYGRFIRRHLGWIDGMINKWEPKNSIKDITYPEEL